MKRSQTTKRERWSPPLATPAVFLVALVVLGARLGSPGLLEPDEARYAAVGRSMLSGRDFVTPRLNGFAYLDKPPMLHWLTALSVATFGANEFAARFFSTIAAAAGIALTYAFGRQVFGHRAGVASAVVLTSCLMWFGIGRVIRYDMLLALSIAATIWCAWLASEQGRDGRRHYILAAASMGLGVLVKGPVAAALPLLIALPYFAITRRLRVLRDVPWLACVGVFAVIVAPWFVLCERANPGAVRFFLLHENVSRVKGEIDPTHWRPWWYFLAVLPGAAFPWTLFLPGALIDAVGGWRRGEEPHRRACTLWVLWIAITVGVFSISKVKLLPYILPAMPAVALIIGRHLSPVRRRGRWSAILTGLIFAAGSYAWMTVGVREAAANGLPTYPLLTLMAGVWLAGGLAAVLLAATQQRRFAILALALSALGTYHLAVWAVELLPQSPSDKSTAEMVAELRRPDERIFCVRKLSRGTMFYLNTRVRVIGNPPAEFEFPGNAPKLEGWVYPLEQADEVLSRGPPALVICRHRLWDEFSEAAPDRIKPIGAVGRNVIFRSIPLNEEDDAAGEGS